MKFHPAMEIPNICHGMASQRTSGCAKISASIDWASPASGGAVLPIDEVANAAGTVGYELMCALALRVPTRVDD